MSVIQQLTEWFLSRSHPVTLELGTRWFRRAAGSWPDTRCLVTGRAAVPAPRMLVFSSHLPYAIFDTPAFDEAIRNLFGGKIPPETYASLVIPDQAFHSGTMTVSSVAMRTNPVAMLEREIQATAPMPLKEYKIVFEVGATMGAKSQVHFFALHKGILTDLEANFQRLGIIPLAIQPSIVRLIHLLKASDRERAPYPSVLLHFGQEGSTFAIFSNAGLKRMQFLPTGGTDLDKLLCRDAGISPAEVEAFKEKEVILLDDPASDAQGEVAAYRAIEPLFIKLLQRLYAFLQAHTAEFPNECCFQRIVLSGGAACLRHLDKLIVANLGIPVTTIGNLFESRGPGGTLNLLEKTQWAPALGDLALQPWRLDRFDKVAAA